MRVLDTGTEGVVIPSVDSADDTRAAVAACLYPPAGVRGMAHVLCRASDYGRKAETDAARLSSPLKKGLFVGAHSRGRNVAAKPS